MATTWNERNLDAIAQQAAEWFFRYRDGLSAAERNEFIDWLRASPLHVQEYLAVSALAQELSERVMPDQDIAVLLAQAQADSDQVLHLRPQRLPATETMAASSHRWLGIAASVVFAVLVAAGIYVMRQGAVQDYQVAGAGQGMWRLADGSLLHLDAYSEARVTYDDQQRLIELRRGTGYFEVKHRPQPFRVVTSHGAVLATGTRFLVRQEPTRTAVVVYAGSVQATDSSGQHSLDLQTGRSALLQSGQPVSFASLSGKQMLAWMRREITFDSKPLGEVLAEFNRYALFPIEVNDAELARLPISGVFNAYDATSFMMFLRNLPGVQVHMDVERERVQVLRVPSAQSAMARGADPVHS